MLEKFAESARGSPACSLTVPAIKHSTRLKQTLGVGLKHLAQTRWQHALLVEQEVLASVGDTYHKTYLRNSGTHDPLEKGVQTVMNYQGA